MVEHYLYGAKVFCAIPLFDHPVLIPAATHGEHAALELLPRNDGGMQGNYNESMHLYTTHGREVLLHTDRELASSVPGQPWCLEVAGVVSFTWTGGEPVIRYQLHDDGTWPLLIFWFVHIFLPLHLTLQRSYDFIHAAAVEVNGQAILFIGPSTGGKSTLGDYFLKRGHPMLSDDKVAAFRRRGEYYAVPSHPHHRPFREFEVLGYPVEPFAERSRPIHAFYVLEWAKAGAGVELTEVTGFRKFEELLPNYLYHFRFLQEQRLRWLAQLASQSLVFRVSRPRDLARMHEVYELVCEHSRQLRK